MADLIIWISGPDYININCFLETMSSLYNCPSTRVLYRKKRQKDHPTAQEHSKGTSEEPVHTSTQAHTHAPTHATNEQMNWSEFEGSCLLLNLTLPFPENARVPNGLVEGNMCSDSYSFSNDWERYTVQEEMNQIVGLKLASIIDVTRCSRALEAPLS